MCLAPRLGLAKGLRVKVGELFEWLAIDSRGPGYNTVMRRWLFNIAAGVSGVLMVVVCYTGLGWAPTPPTAKRVVKNVEYFLDFTSSIAFIQRRPIRPGVTVPAVPAQAFDQRFFSVPLTLHNVKSWEFAGVAFKSYSFGKSATSWVQIPYWFPAVLTAILPALWLYRRIRHRTKPGHCVGCGYNLKGTIEAGRTECPECGKAIEAKV